MTPSFWDSSVLAEKRGALHIRSRAMAAVREFFSAEGFIEVDTPALQICPGLDRHIRPLASAVRQPFSDRSQTVYLHTSPEFAMKRLLAGGEHSIFQICHVFRDGERGPRHHPEFTLLEWYRADSSIEAVMADVEALIGYVCNALSINSLAHSGNHCSVPIPWRQVTVADAFEKHAGIDVLATVDDPHLPSGTALTAEARRIGVNCSEQASWDDAFHAIFLDKIEPNLSQDGGLFLMDYPTPVGALARRSPADDRVCERAEAIVCGLELSNGYSELTDPVEQRARFERDRDIAASLYGSAPPVDETFLAALADMPPAAGMALGFDRLVMLLTGEDDIQNVLWESLPTSS